MATQTTVVTPKYERKCANWLQSFVSWSLPRTEAPENFILWAGIFCLSVALRRKVFVGKKYLGGWTCYPHTYLMFVGPPGLRKTTTMLFADDLLENIQRIPKAPTITTQAALQTALTQSADASIYILSEEFSDLIMKSGLQMFEWLTSMYDGKKYLDSATLMRGSEGAMKPCINLFAATTPKWIAENMPESIIGGGFASRVVFVYEEKLRTRQMYYEGVDHKYLDKIKSDLISDLQHIADNLAGEFEIEESAKMFMEGWYRKHAEGDNDDHRLEGYFQRRPAHIHKIAMLLHIARSDTLVIEIEDFEKAIHLLSNIERRLPRAFQSVGKNTFAPTLVAIFNYIKSKQKVRPVELARQFYSEAEPNKFEELISGLMRMDSISMITEQEGEGENAKNVQYYIPKRAI